MRCLRGLLGIVGPCALLGAVVACSPAEAAGAEGVWVEVSPDTIDAGEHVIVRADCGPNMDSARVASEAFGTISLERFTGFLRTEVRVPRSTRQGVFDVILTCPKGETATTTLIIQGRKSTETAVPTTRPTMGPHTGGGFLAARGDGHATLAERLAGPAGWLSGGGVALVSAAVLATVSRRRSARRARPRRSRTGG